MDRISHNNMEYNPIKEYMNLDILLLLSVTLLVATIVLFGAIFFMFVLVIPLNYMFSKHKVWVF